MRRFASEEVKQKILDLTKTDTERRLILEMDDPVFWAENHFSDPDTGETRFKTKEQFIEVLQCGKKDRALRTGRQLGKCEAEDTKIQLADGSQPTAGEIFNKVGPGGRFKIVSIDQNTFKSTITDAYIEDNGIKPLFKIFTSSGRETTNTDNHPYWIWRDEWETPQWIEATEVRIGDRIAVIRDLGICNPSSRTLSKEEAELLGYIVGDGGTSQHTIKFSTKDIELVDRINSLLEILNTNTILSKINDKYDYSFKIQNTDLYTKGAGRKSWITQFIERHGLKGTLATNKKVPPSIFTSDKQSIAHFIGACWSTDGWISKKGSGTEVEYCSSSKDLIYGIHTLLLRIGITSRLYQKRVKYKDGYNTTWVISINNTNSLESFKKTIPIFHIDKHHRLQNVILKNTNNNTDTIPRGVWNRVFKILDYLKLKPSYLTTDHNERIRTKYSPTRHKLVSQTSKLQDSFLDNISKSDIIWDTVKKTENKGFGQTYAIMVPETNTLITDNIISHNTVHMCIDILHTGHHNKNFVIPVFIPSKKNMDRMMEIMGNLLRMSDLARSFVVNKAAKSRKDDSDKIEPKFDYEIICASGSVIRFFLMGNNPDKARGQSARGAMYMDEVEYLPEKAFSVILGILKSNPDIKIWASSTPSGFVGTWFRDFSDKCAEEDYKDGQEFHLPTTGAEDWDIVEPRLRAVIFDDVTWQLEVLAEWATAKGAVYKKEIIDESVERSKIGDLYIDRQSIFNTLQYQKAPKFLGIDWNNPQNGVRIVELALLEYNGPKQYWVTRNEIIAYEEYTQTRSIERIMELYDAHYYKKISVDSGYGEYQIEKLTQELVARGKDPAEVLHVVNCNSGTEEVEINYKCPIDKTDKTEVVKVRVKDRIVNLVSSYLEHSLVLLKEDDIDKKSIVAEIRNFARKEKAQAGGFVYTDKTHSLSALQIGLHGIERYNRSVDLSTPVIQRFMSESRDTIMGFKMKEEIQQTSFMSMGKRVNSRTGGLTDGRSRRSIL